jgi:hypothetical protein
VLGRGIIKVTALIFTLLAPGTVSGAAMVVSVHEEPVLLANVDLEDPVPARHRHRIRLNGCSACFCFRRSI